MVPSARELIEAKEAAAALLEQLQLDSYVFEVEATDGPWAVHIECAHAGAWQTLVIDVEREQLLASRRDDAERRQLLQDWRRRLGRSPGDAPLH